MLGPALRTVAASVACPAEEAAVSAVAREKLVGIADAWPIADTGIKLPRFGVQVARSGKSDGGVGYSRSDVQHTIDESVTASKTALFKGLHAAWGTLPRSFAARGAGALLQVLSTILGGVTSQELLQNGALYDAVLDVAADVTDGAEVVVDGAKGSSPAAAAAAAAAAAGADGERKEGDFGPRPCSGSDAVVQLASAVRSWWESLGEAQWRKGDLEGPELKLHALCLRWGLAPQKAKAAAAGAGVGAGAGDAALLRTVPSMPSQHIFIRDGTASSLPGTWMRRLRREWRMLGTSLPQSRAEGFVYLAWALEKQPTLMSALIVPTPDTPYSGGAFVFDISIPRDYPANPPKFRIRTTDGGRVRFNPNLYADGKVRWGGGGLIRPFCATFPSPARPPNARCAFPCSAPGPGSPGTRRAATCSRCCTPS